MCHFDDWIDAVLFGKATKIIYDPGLHQCHKRSTQEDMAIHEFWDYELTLGGD